MSRTETASVITGPNKTSGKTVQESCPYFNIHESGTLQGVPLFSWRWHLYSLMWRDDLRKLLTFNENCLNFLRGNRKFNRRGPFQYPLFLELWMFISLASSDLWQTHSEVPNLIEIRIIVRELARSIYIYIYIHKHYIHEYRQAVSCSGDLKTSKSVKISLSINLRSHIHKGLHFMPLRKHELIMRTQQTKTQL